MDAVATADVGAALGLNHEEPDRHPGLVSTLPIAQDTTTKVERILMTLATQMATREDLRDWCELGLKIAAIDDSRLDVAIHAAIDAVRTPLTVEEVAAISDWFVAQVREAMDRGGYHAGYALWMLCVGDDNRTGRCISELMTDACELFRENDGPPPGEFLDAAQDYAYTALVQLSEHEVNELRRVVAARGADLDEWAPFNLDRRYSDIAPVEALERACFRFLTARSNKERADAFDDHADGTNKMRTDYTMTTAYRFGLVAWFAQRCLKKRPSKRSAKEAR